MEAPHTVFLPLHVLQSRLGLAGRCNALLVGEVHTPLAEALRANLQLADWGLLLQGPRERVETLFRRLDANQDDKLQPREWRDRLAASDVEAIHSGRNPVLTRAEVGNFYYKERNYLSLESTQLLLEPFISDAALAAANDAHFARLPPSFTSPTPSRPTVRRSPIR